MVKELPLFIKILVIAFLINVMFTCLVSYCSMLGMSLLAGNENGEKIFKANCSGCHLNGQNLIKAEKPIIGSLKLKSKQAFIAHLQNPPPPMPNFKNIASESSQLDALYSYVVTLMGK